MKSILKMGRFQVISFFSSSDAHPVRELGLELGDLKVDLVQVLVHKSHQALLHHLGKVKIIATVFQQDVKKTKQNHRNTAFTSLLHTFAKGKSIMYDQTIQNYYRHQFHLNVSSNSKYVDQYW